MNTTHCFATTGELVRFAYDAFGVLPRKDAPKDDGMDETQKKTLQKQLARLAKEEGHLQTNVGQVIQSLSSLLADYLPSFRIMGALGDTLGALLESYNALVRREGTYLNKAQSLQYFISVHALPRFVQALNHSLLQYKLTDLEPTIPDEAFWYLPTVDAQSQLTWPLEKVMRWTYQRCDTSQTQFHYPGKSPSSADSRAQQRLEQAIKWTRGTRLPSLPALMKNFNDSFAALAEQSRPVPAEVQLGIHLALIVARVTTYVGKQLHQSYDAHYLAEVCNQYRDYSHWIAEDINKFKMELAPKLAQCKSVEEEFDLWLKAVPHYWRFFKNKLVTVGDSLNYFQSESPDEQVSQELVEALESKYGTFALRVHLDVHQRQAVFQHPDGFFGLLSLGLQLKGDPSRQLQQIEAFAGQVSYCGLDSQLDWLVTWVHAVYHYCREEFDDAMRYFHLAFESAKYRAGSHQYELVNHYIELAAKTDDRRAFNKGIEWAQYLGLEVRWLRGNEPTEEMLNTVYAIMKRARYDHQM